MARILIHTLGSSGDFNPLVALALELRERGHVVHFALNPHFAARVRDLGFTATEAGPDPDAESDLMKRLLAPARNGVHLVNILFREILIPGIRPAAEALMPLAREADLFVSHTIQLAAPVVARTTGVPWVSVSPAALLFETGDYPVPGVAWRGMPAPLSRLGWAVARRIFRPFDALANAEYAALGQPPLSDIAIGGAYSRRLTLGLWSPSYFPRPADWPDWLQVGGYGRWDAPGRNLTPGPSPPERGANVKGRHLSAPPELGAGGPLFLSPSLEERGPGGEVSWAAGGVPPLIVFTLGSTVVSDPRGFYELALRAVAPTHWRALLVGAPDDLPIPAPLQGRVRAVRYAPYGDVFPLADVLVHSGGVGTTQAGCFYGKPAVIVPRGADQFENAAHVQREGWGLRLKPEDLSATLLRRRLERLLEDREIHRRVAALGERMRAENGPARSADLLEVALERPAETLTALGA